MRPAGLGGQRFTAAADDRRQDDDHDRNHKHQEAEGEHRYSDGEHHSGLRPDRHVGHHAG